MEIEFYKSPGGRKNFLHRVDADCVPHEGDVVVIGRTRYEVSSVGWVLDYPSMPATTRLVANVFLEAA